MIEIVVFGIIFLGALIPSIILFYNHWKYSRDIVVSIKKDAIHFFKNDKEYIVAIDSRNSITETAPYGYKLLWSDFRFWTFSIEGMQFKVSSLILPKSEMDYFYWNKTMTKYKNFPLIDGYS